MHIHTSLVEVADKIKIASDTTIIAACSSVGPLPSCFFLTKEKQKSNCITKHCGIIRGPFAYQVIIMAHLAILVIYTMMVFFAHVTSDMKDIFPHTYNAPADDD